MVVPPGIDSPIMRQSHRDASLPPVWRPDSSVWRAWDVVMAGPSRMLPPGSMPASMWGTCGRTGPPAFMAMWGISDDMRAARVSTAGVGLPSGVVGMASMQRQRPYSMYSASAGGVYIIESGPAPATVMPGISAVRVYDSTSEKSARASPHGLQYRAGAGVAAAAYHATPSMRRNSPSVLGCSTGLVLSWSEMVEVLESP